MIVPAAFIFRIPMAASPPVEAMLTAIRTAVDMHIGHMGFS
jgi:hypothetical protein